MSHLNHCLVCFHLEQDCCEGKSDGSHCRCCTPVFFSSFVSCVPASDSLDKVHLPLLDLFSQRYFFRNCLHTSRSCAVLQSGQGIASDFLSFLFWLLLLAISCNSVAKVLTLSLWVLLLKPVVFLSLPGSSRLASSFCFTVVTELQAIRDSL